jgi:hypothetical protein
VSSVLRSFHTLGLKRYRIYCDFELAPRYTLVLGDSAGKVFQSYTDRADRYLKIVRTHCDHLDSDDPSV